MINLEPITFEFNQLQNQTSSNLRFNTFQTSAYANYVTTGTADTIILWRPIYKVDKLIDTAKIFESEVDQAVRLPAGFSFENSEALVKRQTKEAAWQTLLHAIRGFSDDFMADGRPPEKADMREEL